MRLFKVDENLPEAVAERLRAIESLVPFLEDNRLEGRLWIVRSGEVRVRE